MKIAQRTKVKVIYEGVDITKDITPFLLDYEYTDSENISEDIIIDLENRDSLWIRDWFPNRGDKITTVIQIIDEDENVEELPCGIFEIDDLNAKGPPDRVSIKGISTFLSEEIKDTKRSQAWEKVKYKYIATEIAKRNGYEIIFNIKDKNNKDYDKVDQNHESDIEFLLRISDDLNFGVKVENAKIVISDEEFYEDMDPLFTIHYEDMESRKKGIQRNKKFSLINYEVSQSALTSYTAAEIQYKDPESGEVFKAKVGNEKEQVSEKILRLNEKVKSNEEAEELCKKALEKQNKETNTAKFTLAPRFPISAKTVIEIKDFGVFDGKYLINSVAHNISNSGYTVNLDCSKFIVGAGQLKSGQESQNKSESEKDISQQPPGIDKMLAYARAQLGKTYSQKNRMSPNSFDCSSLVSRSMSAAGLAPPGAAWSTRTLANSGYLVEIDHSQIQPGDILNKYDDHAMIYAGNGQVIEAQVKRGVVIGNGSPSRINKYKIYRVKGVV